MKVQTITLHNFGSFYGTHQVRLSERGLVFVRGENMDEPKMESNGSGKSTLFDALAWCLFGHVPKGDVAKSIVNNEAKDSWVVVHLTDEPPNQTPVGYWIHRSRKSSSQVQFFKGLEAQPIQNLTTMDTNVTQAAINKELGLDKDVFYAAVYRAQGEGDEFAEATDAKRKELLTKIIPELVRVDELQDRAKTLLKEEQLKLSGLHTQRQAAEQEKALLQARNFAAEKASWEQDRINRLGQSNQWLEQAKAAKQAAEASLQQAQGLQAQLQALAAPEASTQWQTELQKRQEKVAQEKEGHDLVKFNHDSFLSDLAKLQAMTVGKCFECGQPITEQHKQVEIQKLQGVIEESTPHLSAARQALDTAQAQVTEAKQYVDQEAAANSAAWKQYADQKASLEAQLNQLSSVDMKHLDSQIQKFGMQSSSIAAEVWPGTESEQQTQTRIAELDQMITSTFKEEEQVQFMIKHLEFWHTGLSNAGLKSYILDSRIEEMTKSANEWVSALTGGTTWVRFETQTLTQGGKLNEKFNIRVFRHDPNGGITERNFKSWSGGEKKRVSLGIDQGISTLIADRATKHWGLYIIDESFRQHLDQGGREAIFELLEKLGDERESIFVVDHDPQMGAQFENQLVVRIQNRRSWFPHEPHGEHPLEPKAEAHLPVVG